MNWSELFASVPDLFKDATTGEYLWEPGQPIPVPRCMKSREEQKNRTKSKAEVFTPSWVVKKMTDALEEENPDIYSNPKSTFLEITCGEAPFITVRNEPDSGEAISPENRFGVLDRKIKCAQQTGNAGPDVYLDIIKSVYGYEYQLDSLMLARMNVLETMLEVMDDNYINELADIIHRNFFNMDGLAKKIPDTDISPIVRFWNGPDGEPVDVLFETIGAEDE